MIFRCGVRDNGIAYGRFMALFIVAAVTITDSTVFISRLNKKMCTTDIAVNEGTNTLYMESNPGD